MPKSDGTANATFIDPELERSNCLFAVPKKGRLYEKCMQMVLGAGLEHHRPNRLDVAHCTNLNVTIVFLPAADIATYVAEGDVDVGITGVDCVEENNADVKTILVDIKILSVYDILSDSPP
jgi:ATP phosphoribosyltransferase